MLRSSPSALQLQMGIWTIWDRWGLPWSQNTPCYLPSHQVWHQLLCSLNPLLMVHINYFYVHGLSVIDKRRVHAHLKYLAEALWEPASLGNDWQHHLERGGNYATYKDLVWRVQNTEREKDYQVCHRSDCHL